MHRCMLRRLLTSWPSRLENNGSSMHSQPIAKWPKPQVARSTPGACKPPASMSSDDDDDDYDGNGKHSLRRARTPASHRNKSHHTAPALQFEHPNTTGHKSHDVHSLQSELPVDVGAAKDTATMAATASVAAMDVPDTASGPDSASSSTGQAAAAQGDAVTPLASTSSKRSLWLSHRMGLTCCL